MRFTVGIEPPGTAGTYDAAALALFARMSPAPSTPRKTTINNLIVALKGYGIWAKLDVLYLFAADSSTNALLNWHGTSNTATNFGQTFTTDRGFTGAGSYIETVFDPTAGGHQFTLNAHSFGVWMRIADAANGREIFAFDGFEGYQIGAAGAGLFAADTGAGGSVITPGGAVIGNLTVSRTAQLSWSFYQNGSSIGTNSLAPAINPCTFQFLNQNVANGQASAGFLGGALTSTEVANFDTALRAYMTAVGAYP